MSINKLLMISEIVGGGGGGGDVTVESLSVTENGTYSAPSGKAYSPVSVNVQPTLQSKSVTPSETEQTVTPDNDYDGLSSVLVGAISGTYVGSEIDRRSSSDLEASGATVSVPAGYYESAASKAVESGSASTPATSIAANPTISVDGNGLITASVGASESVTPTVVPGYVSEGTAGTVSVSGSNTSQLPAKASATYTPTTTDQTIAANQYLTGAQTVKGDANLVAGNIKKDTTIFGVTGTYEGGGGGGTVEENDVNFYDYDGSIVASYSAADFANLSAMPANPSHTGLTAQGWNWTLADAKAYVADTGMLDIGQMYVTSDGKTRIYIHLEDGRLSPYLGILINGTADVDWGDNSAHDTLTGTDLSTLVTALHNYAAPGDYVIAIDVVSGEMCFSGPYASGLISKNASYVAQNYVYCNTITKVEIGSNVTLIGGNAFAYCRSLKSVTIPSNVTNIYSGAFSNCTSLTFVSVPTQVTAFVIGTFNGCISIKRISVPRGFSTISGNLGALTSLSRFCVPPAMTLLSNNCFDGCKMLASVAFPSESYLSVSLFRNCESLKKFVLKGNKQAVTSTAFYGCKSLSSISLPQTIETIGQSPFYSCEALSAFTVPPSVTYIFSEAFNGCYGLRFIRFEPTTPADVQNSNAFANISEDCIMYVPFSALAAYLSGTNYPAKTTYTYIGFATYTSGDTLPTQDGTQAYNVTWYATQADAIAQTNAITTGNGSEIYCRYTAAA